MVVVVSLLTDLIQLALKKAAAWSSNSRIWQMWAISSWSVGGLLILGVTLRFFRVEWGAKLLRVKKVDYRFFLSKLDQLLTFSSKERFFFLSLSSVHPSARPVVGFGYRTWY